MGDVIARMARRLFVRPPAGVEIVRPAPQPLRMVPGGPAAPELCMVPVDIDPNAIEPGYVQLKGDGYRALRIDGQIVSREGVPLDCARHCLPGLEHLEKAFGEPMMFDGEYVEEEGYDATARAYKRGIGEGVFWLFDAVPMREWLVNDCRQPFEMRMGAITKRLDRIGSPFVGFLLPFYMPDAAAVKAKAEELWDWGYEGIVWKRPGSRYRRDRSDDWRRWKQLVTVDCRVLDTLPGPAGLAKGLIVQGPEGPIRVTTGFSMEDRRQLAIAQLPSHGGWPRWVEIAFNKKAGSGKVRHARFVRFRHDKEGQTDGK